MLGFTYNDIYSGEIDPETKQSYLTVNEKSEPVENVVNMIYPLSGVPHFASFQSTLNERSEAYYQVNLDNVLKISEGKVILYE